MQLVIDMLTDQGIEPNVEELREAITMMGYDPDNLNKAQSQQLVKLYIKAKSESAISTTETSKPTTRRKRETRGDRLPDMAEALRRAAQANDAEIRTFTDIVIGGAQEITENEAQRLVDELREQPVHFVRRVGELAMEAEADTEFFRELGQKYRSIFNPDPSSLSA